MPVRRLVPWLRPVPDLEEVKRTFDPSLLLAARGVSRMGQAAMDIGNNPEQIPPMSEEGPKFPSLQDILGSFSLGNAVENVVPNIESGRQRILSALPEPVRTGMQGFSDVFENVTHPTVLSGLPETTSKYPEGVPEDVRKNAALQNLLLVAGMSPEAQGFKSIKQIFGKEGGGVPPKSPIPPTEPPIPPGSTPGTPPSSPNPWQKLVSLIESAKKPSEESIRILQQQHTERAVAAEELRMRLLGEGVNPLEAQMRATARLRGEFPKPDFEPPAVGLSPDDITALHNDIQNAPPEIFRKGAMGDESVFYTRLNTTTALDKLINGVVPTPSEQRLLRNFFQREIPTPGSNMTNWAPRNWSDFGKNFSKGPELMGEQIPLSRTSPLPEVAPTYKTPEQIAQESLDLRLGLSKEPISGNIPERPTSPLNPIPTQGRLDIGGQPSMQGLTSAKTPEQIAQETLDLRLGLAEQPSAKGSVGTSGESPLLQGQATQGRMSFGAEPPITPSVSKTETERITSELELRRFLGEVPRPTTWENLEDVLNIPRSLKFSFDQSMILNQGLVLGIRDFQGWKEAFRKNLDVIGSESNAYTIDKMIHSGPRESIWLRTDMPLFRAPVSPNVAMILKEESNPSRLLTKIPIVGTALKVSQRTFNTFMNVLRQHYADKLATQWEREAGVGIGQLPMSRYSEIAKLANYSSGRGTLKFGSVNLEGLGPIVNGIGFGAPRFHASRVQLFGMVLNPNASRVSRVEAAKSLVGVFATNVAWLGLLKASGAGDVNLDSNSPDFGKGHIGPFYFDTWGGYQQFARLISNMASSSYIPLGSKKSENRPGMSALGLFLRSKEAPVGAWIHDVIDRKDYTGNKVNTSSESVKRQIVNLLSPLVAEAFWEAIEGEGLVPGLAAGGTSFFGVREQYIPEHRYIPGMRGSQNVMPNVPRPNVPNIPRPQNIPVPSIR